MGIHITIQNNTFSDKSAAIKDCSFSETSSTDKYFDYIKELNELKEQVNSNEKLYEALTELKTALSEKNKPKISDVVLSYASEFSQTFFTGIASSALLDFISKF